MNGIQESSITLENAVELATRIIQRVAGDAVSSNLAGQPISGALISQTVTAKIQSGLKLEVGAI